jgi:hypothetical protein
MKHNVIFSLLFPVFILLACNPKTQHNSNASADLPVIFEIVTADSQATFDNHYTDVSVYQWKNHLVLYGFFADLQTTHAELAEAFPNSQINLYENPFYVFNRSECENQTTAENWSHVIMTCNLVDNDSLQAEYMDYHARQRELFPEVAQGFCRAEFQQLLVYRRERQLMLVISIPADKTLDELNPKTSENNPRVDDWNAIMSHYQTGIEGTEEGESWVVLVDSL